ncbi:hypothetical protein EYF80_037026 [Liparis tanakae]|uniref:Secreted protein n=1 Tax=Liparis tanakae TaxID=230148 RepID=A0A4Z2GIU6_9TELE|nr:hypothetical protein EYF80_037026 [Liparis tanakae]
MMMMVVKMMMMVVVSRPSFESPSSRASGGRVGGRRAVRATEEHPEDELLSLLGVVVRTDTLAFRPFCQE